jgi:mono/diheme cytochrome c family protein
MHPIRLTRKKIQTALIVGLLAGLQSLHASDTTEPSPVDVHMRTPEEELATFQLPPGYHLELVASDPDVISPVICTWDGDGRMYVAEMRSYMLDINGTRAHTPISRVSRWESTHGDGVYDKHTVFADNLMLPRMILPLDDRVLIRQTDTKDIYSYRDTTGDGTADEIVKFYEGGRQEGNLEHQPSGLVWDIDNWIYVTAQPDRFRYTRQKVEKGRLPFRSGQWGIAMTDTGQLVFNAAGSERPAFDFQVMPQYGEIGLPGELAKDFEAVYPIETLTDVEGGLPRLRPQGGLNHFTGCAGGCIYRGDALPADLNGDYILPEPVGRLIRAAKLSQVDGKTIISNACDQKEFIASTDPNFRPVWAATGPDGCLYFCDMYHGIIQEANWTKEGSYLRGQIKKYGLQKNIGKGRIWRLVHDGSQRHRAPHMLEESPAQLVKHLSDPNGWWRDTAQKLIVLKGDKSVVSELTELARQDANPITRLHALWTLEGLDSVTDDLLIEKTKDADPRLRAAAIRIAEPLVTANDSAIVNAIKAMATDHDPAVAMQLCLSVLSIKTPYADALVTATIATTRDGAGNDNVKAAVQKYRDNAKKAAEEEAKEAELAKSNAAKGALFAKGRDAYGQTCIACHAPDGEGMPAPEHNGTRLAPPLHGSKKLMADKQLVARIVLHGLTGPNNGVTYPGQMASFKWADDEWLASILTYARNDWGNNAPAIEARDIAAIRKLDPGRTGPFTVAELYNDVQATSPVTPSGAKVQARPGEILLDPAAAQLHGEQILLDCGSTGLDIGFWENWQDWISWSPRLAPGDYTITARLSNPGKPHDFSMKIANQEWFGTVPVTPSFSDYQDVPLGIVHLDQGGEVPVEVRPRSAQNWGATNLSAVRLMPTTRPASATQKAE